MSYYTTVRITPKRTFEKDFRAFIKEIYEQNYESWLRKPPDLVEFLDLSDKMETKLSMDLDIDSSYTEFFPEQKVMNLLFASDSDKNIIPLVFESIKKSGLFKSRDIDLSKLNLFIYNQDFLKNSGNYYSSTGDNLEDLFIILGEEYFEGPYTVEEFCNEFNIDEKSLKGKKGKALFKDIYNSLNRAVILVKPTKL